MTSARLPVPCPCAATRAASLRGKGGLNELAQEGLGQIRRKAEPLGLGAAAQNHVPLASEVARGASGRTFHRGHLLAQGLAARDQRQQLAVEVTQRGTQFVQIHRRADPMVMPIPFSPDSFY